MGHSHFILKFQTQSIFHLPSCLIVTQFLPSFWVLFLFRTPHPSSQWFIHVTFSTDLTLTIQRHLIEQMSTPLSATPITKGQEGKAENSKPLDSVTTLLCYVYSRPPFSKGQAKADFIQGYIFVLLFPVLPSEDHSPLSYILLQLCLRV